MRGVNFYPCGFLIHPDAPWLGSSPDGIIYDPTEHQVFRLFEIKCPNLKSYVDCPLPEAAEWHTRAKTTTCLLLTSARSDADLGIGLV